MDYLAVSNQDVENGIDNIIEFIGKLWAGVEAVIDVLPPVVLGFILFIAFCLYLIRKARSG